MSRRLALHIGHSKTGSSFLQSALALSGAALRQAGVVYPVSGNAPRARAGLMTTGNGDDLRAAISADDPARLGREAGAVILYSAEHLTPLLAEPGRLDALRRIARAHDFDQIALFLIIRDPMEHLLSDFSQKIKGGRAQTLPRLARNYDHPELVARLIDAAEQAPEVTLTVRNYRQIKGDLIGSLADWLGQPQTLFERPPREVVNRSLTADELAFQIRLNERLGRCPGVISEPLMRDLPHQSGRAPTLGRTATRALFRRLGPAIQTVNRALPREHRYHTGGPLRLWTPRQLLAAWRRATGGEDVRLSPDQVRVIVDGFADEIEKARATAKPAPNIAGAGSDPSRPDGPPDRSDG